MLVIDARASSNVRAAVDAAAARAPKSVVLVFAEGAAEKQLGVALKGSKVFAVLPTPVDVRKTQAVMEGAIAEALASKAEAARPAASSAAELSIGAFRAEPAPAAASAGSGGTPRGSKTLLIAAAVAAVAAAAGGIWYFSHGSTPAGSAPAAPKVASTAAPAQTAPAGRGRRSGARGGRYRDRAGQGR